MNAFIQFELGTYFKKPGIYFILCLLTAFGFYIGHNLSFNEEISPAAAYSIANMIGLLSLSSIFIVSLFAAQILFKEQDANFTLILYATPLSKTTYAFSRFAALFGLSCCCLITLIAGYCSGQINREEFNLWYYIQPTLILAIPNLFLCAAIVCSVAWLSKNKLIVYLSGLLLYIIYMVMLLYSGSPMMAASLPQSTAAMEWSAKTDPFGLSAFYQQTNAWTLTQKNIQLLDFSGNLLLNRLSVLLLATLLLLVAFKNLKLSIAESGKKKRNTEEDQPAICYDPVQGMPVGWAWHLQVLRSYVSVDMRVVIKSIPFVLINICLIFYLSMEFYGSIDQGIRIPEQYASTALMVNRIIFNLPGILLMIVLFYAHELYHRSKAYRFHLIENSSPAGNASWFLSKWISLSVLILLLTSVIILNGIIFQLIYQYNKIDWPVYAALYWLIDAPLIICAGIILSVQSVISNKWGGLLISCLFMFLLATSFGKSLGLTHPLLRFAAAYTARYSDMNGWDNYFPAFSWKTLYGISVVSLLVLTVLKFRRLSGAALIAVILCGIYISHFYHRTHPLDQQQAYEQQYRPFRELAQPDITAVKAFVDLFPEKNSYQVKGTYQLINNSQEPISKLLVNYADDKTSFIYLKQPLMPHDTSSFNFSFSYHWNGFNGHQAFNAIVNNGTFIRFSNYFPRFGYQSDKEISSSTERAKRHLGAATPLPKLEGPRSPYYDFIKLDLTVSTSADQTVIGVGRLSGKWKHKDRNYFRYQTDNPGAFRFGISSARYAVQTVNHQGINIEVYYDQQHAENVQHLIANAAKTLDYCQLHFGAYPYKTIRFAEVSSFTQGFAGTAYPATIFMTEDIIFHNNLKADREQDVINELAAHELSHQWWGVNKLVPDEREGSKLLTETLAMYTELMLVKHNIGQQRMLENVNMHQRIYQNERGFSSEEALYKVKPESTHLSYSKGLVVMYRLKELIGEEQVNRALANLIKKHAYPNPRPVSTDLLAELYKVSSPAVYPQIDTLLKNF